MTHSNVDRLQCPDAGRAFGEVGVGVHQDFQRPVEADQQVRKVPVNNSGQVGPCALREICGDVVTDLKTPPCNLATAKFNSIRAEEVLVLGVLGFGKNGLDFCLRIQSFNSSPLGRALSL